MSARIIDGKAIAAGERERAGEEAAAFARRFGRPPALAVVLVGDDPASQVYVRSKTRLAEEAGLRSIQERRSAGISQGELEALVRGLSADPAVDGVLVQLPLPAPLDPDPVIAAITPDKDVDGLTEASMGRLM
ncbi:MAG: bifunctional methylenetetrahydrofolate dehydrogenase/methenyltetrahydrofolate cyclohydrolase, partial [Caulobacterales bacterium]|nr:bifunctional methylenetetrahydrofolate dehydrogenase/methenyltetrahydrofolate cyclohydrolase [Caulobacterales bacterium]